MRNATLISAVVLLNITTLLGCQRASPADANAKVDQLTTKRQVDNVASRIPLDYGPYEPANQLEIVDFGQQVASAVVGQEVEGLNKLIDWQCIYIRSTESVDSSDESKAIWVDSLNSVTSQPVLNVLISSAAKGGSFAFLGARDLDGRESALFRIIQPSGSLNYCDMCVGRSTDGELRCIDMRAFTTGQYMSETFRDDFRLFVAKHETQKCTPDVEAYLNHAAELAEIAREGRTGDGATACELIAKLPSVLQDNRRVLIMKIQACMHLDDESLLSAIGEFSDRFPNDPATKLYAIQASILMNQHDTALRLLKELDESIGGDPYLDAIRADICFQQSDVETAKSIAYGVIREEQGIDLAYSTLLRIAVEEKAFAEAVKWLDVLYGAGVRQETIEEDLYEYPELIDSPEFREWKERRRQ